MKNKDVWDCTLNEALFTVPFRIIHYNIEFTTELENRLFDLETECEDGTHVWLNVISCGDLDPEDTDFRPRVAFMVGDKNVLEFSICEDDNYRPRIYALTEEILEAYKEEIGGLVSLNEMTAKELSENVDCENCRELFIYYKILSHDTRKMMYWAKKWGSISRIGKEIYADELTNVHPNDGDAWALSRKIMNDLGRKRRKRMLF